MLNLAEIEGGNRLRLGVDFRMKLLSKEIDGVIFWSLENHLLQERLMRLAPIPTEATAKNARTNSEKGSPVGFG